MKGKVLFLIKVPPPITGATLMNQRIYESSKIRDNFITDFILINYLRNRNDFGTLSIRKIGIIIKTIIILTKKLIVDKPDIIYFQITPNGVGFLRDSVYILLIKLFQVSLVLHFRGKGVRASSTTVLQRKYYKFILTGTSILCHSDIVAKDFTHVFNGTYYIVENGIPVEVTDKQIKQKTSSNVPRVLYLSTLMKNKGIFDFLESLRILSDENIKFKAIVIGEPKNNSTLSEILDFIKENGLSEHVSILGAKYGKEKFKYLVNSDIFVFPTLHEAFGNVVLEAFQSQLPVISTDEGSLPVIIDHGVNGYIYPKGDIEMLSKKLKLLISNDDLRIKMGKNGREKFLCNYTIGKFEDRMVEIINRLID